MNTVQVVLISIITYLVMDLGTAILDLIIEYLKQKRNEEYNDEHDYEQHRPQ